MIKMYMLKYNSMIRWPSEKVPLYGIVSFMLKRMNEMNGPYQVITSLFI